MIYLSSYCLGRNADVLRAVDGRTRAGIVCNALDVFGDSRLRNWAREADDLAGLGYASEEIDLRDHFDDRDGLALRLTDLDLLWVVGGNSFALARAMTAAGCSNAVRSALANGMIYAGYSAGACVAGPDLQGIELIDAPDAVPEGYPSDVPARTLGLVPFRIVPHWRSDHPESADAERAASYLERLGLPYRTLRDGNALIVDELDTYQVRS